MPAEEEPTPATRLKPLRGFQLLASILLFHLASFVNSSSHIYMSTTMGDIFLLTSYIYVILLTVAIMTLREGDAIRVSLLFPFRVLAIPLYIAIAITCYFSPMTDFSSWIIKVSLLLCFLLSVSFFIEILIVIREFRRLKRS